MSSEQTQPGSPTNFWLVVSTPMKNISQLRFLFPIYGKVKKFQTTKQIWIFWPQFPMIWLVDTGENQICAWKTYRRVKEKGSDRAATAPNRKMNLFPCRLPGEETTISLKSSKHPHMSADTVWTFVNRILQVTLNNSFIEGGWYLLTVMRREAHVTFQRHRDWLTLWPYGVFVPALAPRCLLVRKHGQPLPCHQEP